MFFFFHYHVRFPIEAANSFHQTSTPQHNGKLPSLKKMIFMLEFYSNPTETGGFLTLHNLVCGVSTAALSRKTWLLQRGVLRLVSAAAAEQSLGNSSMGTAAAAAAAAARMRLETRVEKKWKRWE